MLSLIAFFDIDRETFEITSYKTHSKFIQIDLGTLLCGINLAKGNIKEDYICIWAYKGGLGLEHFLLNTQLKLMTK